MTASITASLLRYDSSHASGPATHDSFIIGPDERILVTGAAGFIGSRVVESLVDRGFRNLVCFTRPSSELAGIERLVECRPPGTRIELFKGISGGVVLGTGGVTSGSAGAPAVAEALPAGDLPRTGGNPALPVIGAGLLALAVLSRRIVIGRA